jgi:hypothetical protein
MKKLLIAALLFSSCEKDTIKGCISCEQRKYELRDTESREVREDGFPKINEACDKTAQELVDTLAHIPSVVLGRLYERYELDSATLKMYMITTKCEQR